MKIPLRAAWEVITAPISAAAFSRAAAGEGGNAHATAWEVRPPRCRRTAHVLRCAALRCGGGVGGGGMAASADGCGRVCAFLVLRVCACKPRMRSRFVRLHAPVRAPIRVQPSAATRGGLWGPWPSRRRVAAARTCAVRSGASAGLSSIFRYKFEPDDVAVQLTDELPKHLRQLRTEGSIFKDR